jgi:hypothetical protein
MGLKREDIRKRAILRALVKKVMSLPKGSKERQTALFKVSRQYERSPVQLTMYMAHITMGSYDYLLNS